MWKEIPEVHAATKPALWPGFSYGEPSLAPASKPWWQSRERQSDSLLRRLLPIKAQQQVVTLIGRLAPERASKVGEESATALSSWKTKSLTQSSFQKVPQYKLNS